MSGLRGQGGFTLLEIVIALGILGFIGVGFAAALSAGTRATGTLDEQVQAEALARSYLETIKTCPYARDPATYNSVSCPALGNITIPNDYTVTLDTDCTEGTSFPLEWDLDENGCGSEPLQRITVAVSRTSSGKPLLSLATYKRQ